MKGYNTNLASEFYVLSVLHRKGFDALITLGNKKSVDILVYNGEGKIVTIDVKGIIGKTMFPVDNVDTKNTDSNHFIVFVSYSNAFYDENIIPVTFILPIAEIPNFIYINPKGNRKCVGLSTLRKKGKVFENKWELLRSYGSGYETNLDIQKEKWIEFLVIYNGLKEKFLSFDYFSKSIFFEEFIKIWLSVKEKYPINIQQIIYDYCDFIDINEIKRIKNKTDKLCQGIDISTILSCFEDKIQEKIKLGEVELTDNNAIIEFGKPIPSSIIKSIKQTGDYIKRRKENHNNKIKHGA